MRSLAGRMEWWEAALCAERYFGEDDAEGVDRAAMDAETAKCYARALEYTGQSGAAATRTASQRIPVYYYLERFGIRSLKSVSTFPVSDIWSRSISVLKSHGTRARTFELFGRPRRDTRLNLDGRRRPVPPRPRSKAPSSPRDSR